MRSSPEFKMYYGILAISIEAAPIGAVFHSKRSEFLEPIVGDPRLIPIECLLLFSEAAYSVLPEGVEASDLLFTAAAMLRHGWDERRLDIDRVPPIHELNGHEVVTRCLKTLHALGDESPERVVYCSTQDRNVRVSPKILLNALCRMRREGWLAFDVYNHTSHAHVA